MSKVYRIPEGQRVYAIGDIHGYAEVLARMHDAIENDFCKYPIDKASIIYVGDYIDRGPNSKGVIDQLIEREAVAPHFDHVFLLGNHEDAMFHEFLNDPAGHRQDWLQWGGLETAESYGVVFDKNKNITAQVEEIARALNAALPQKHKEFFENLKLHYIVGDYLFVHAGMKPNVPLDKQTKDDLTFIREPFMSHEGHHQWRVVHGHTPPKSKKIDIRPNRINVDTWLYEGGPLTCAVLEGADIRTIEIFANGEVNARLIDTLNQP